MARTSGGLYQPALSEKEASSSPQIEQSLIETWLFTSFIQCSITVLNKSAGREGRWNDAFMDVGDHLRDHADFLIRFFPAAFSTPAVY